MYNSYRSATQCSFRLAPLIPCIALVIYNHIRFSRISIRGHVDFLGGGVGASVKTSVFSGYAATSPKYISPDSSLDTRPSNSHTELADIWASRLSCSTISHHCGLPTNQAHPPCALTDITQLFSKNTGNFSCCFKYNYN